MLSQLRRLPPLQAGVGQCAMPCARPSNREQQLRATFLATPRQRCWPHCMLRSQEPPPCLLHTWQECSWAHLVRVHGVQLALRLGRLALGRLQPEQVAQLLWKAQQAGAGKSSGVKRGAAWGASTPLSKARSAAGQMGGALHTGAPAHLLRKVAELLPLLHARARQAPLVNLPAVDLRCAAGAAAGRGMRQAVASAASKAAGQVP